LVGKPSPEFPEGDWKSITKYAAWKPIGGDSLELMFGGNSESISMHVVTAGPGLEGRAMWLSDVIESGPKPSMRVVGKEERCPST
jgi:hypothetical protein